MAYTPTYAMADLQAIIVDLIAGVFAALVDNVAILVGLLILVIIIARGKQLLDAVFNVFHSFR